MNDSDANKPVQLRGVPWRRLVAYLRPHWPMMLLALVGLLVSNAISLAFPLVIGSVVGQVLEQGDYAQLDRLMLGLLGLFVIQGLGDALQTYTLGMTGERIVVQLRAELFQHLMRLSLDFFGRHRTGALVSRLSSDVTLVRALLTNNITTLLTEVFSLIGAIILVFTINPSLTFFLLALVPAIVLIAMTLGRRLEGLSTRMQDALAQSTVTAEESISGVRVVKSFSREPYETRRYTGDLGGILGIARQVMRLRAGFGGLMLFLGYGAIAGMIWFAGRQVIAGTMTIALLTSFIIYGVRIAFSFGMLAGLYTEARQALGAVLRVFEIIDTRPSIQDAPDATPLPPVTGALNLRHVDFSYGTDAAVLHNIDLQIAPGEVVALVGPSGAGKSTLFNLLPRFYDPTAGSVEIDGRDIRTVTLDSLRQQIGIVPQDTMLFGGSVRDNIRYGRLDATDAEIEQAARDANAHEFICGLPQGYDTIVGERGTRLSGGQRQRVAIARAILKDPRILLLDEATSALDTESERLVQSALERLMASRTSIIIAHRLSTIVAADRIVVLNGGRIAEVGTHDELLAAGGLFARLHALQFRRDEPLELQPETGYSASV